MNRTLFAFAALALPTFASAADRHVGLGQTYSSIQAAVDAAGNNDVIVVHAGTYAEQVIVDRVDITNLTIKAYGQDLVTIDAPDQVSNAIIANTVNLTLKNLTVEAPNRLAPAQRAINFISETGPLAETYTVGLCGVTLRGSNVTGGAGVACAVGTNDTLRVRGDDISVVNLYQTLTSSCTTNPTWDQDDAFCSGS